MSKVRAILRYPVKSLLGEVLDEVLVDERGCVGDRYWSVHDVDGRFGSGKTTRRFRRMDGLLTLRATYHGDTPVISFPDGRQLRAGTPAVDQALSDHVGRPVTLEREEEISHFDEGPVHLVTTASLDTLSRAHGRPVDLRRTRANFLVDWEGNGFPEHGWVGRRLRVGPDLVLAVRAVMPRCVMVNASQDGLPVDGDLLRTITGVSAGSLGVVADVERAGRVTLGDEVALCS